MLLPAAFEVVYRHMFENNVSVRQQDANAYFLRLLGEDPWPEFVSRFQGHEIPVQAESDWVGPRAPDGIVFAIKGYEWISTDSIHVQAGFWDPGNVQGATRFTLKREQGQWVVANVGRMSVAWE